MSEGEVPGLARQRKFIAGVQTALVLEAVYKGTMIPEKRPVLAEVRSRLHILASACNIHPSVLPEGREVEAGGEFVAYHLGHEGRPDWMTRGSPGPVPLKTPSEGGSGR